MAVTTEQQAAGPGAITEALAQIMSRLRLARWVHHAARGGLIGTVPALIAVVLAHFDVLPIWLPLEAALAIPIIVGIAAGTVSAFRRPISQMDAARLAEARLGLKERLSSALEFEKSPQSTDPETATLRRLQLADAAAYAQNLKSVEAVPLRLPWEAKAFFGALVLIALTLILPNLPVFVPPGLTLERQIVQKTGSKLDKTAKLIQKQADAQHLPGTKRTAAQIQALAKRMEAGRMDKKQALVKMSQLTQQMRQEQQKAAQANSGAGGKSMADAGRQLAQAMAAGQNAAGSSAKQAGQGQKQAGQGQKNGGSGQKNGQKSGQNNGTGAKSGATPNSGFNVPPTGKSGANQAAQNAAQTPSSPEIQKAAQAMQQNDSQALSQQLRQAADKISSGQMSPAQQQQTAQDLQKLADALKNTPMPETQKHAQASADALKRGDKQTAASELKKAAASAEKEAQQQADQQAQSDAAQGVEDAQSQMAGANSPGDVSDSPSQPGQGQGKGHGKGAGKGQGTGGGDGLGDGSGLKSAQGKHGSGKGNGGSGGGGKGGGKPGDTGNGSSPLKHLGKATPHPQGTKLYFGAPLNSGPSKTGPAKKVGANPNGQTGTTASQVPYYNYIGPAQKSAESAMDKEDIPPAYRSDVRRYFNSLNPPTAGR